MGPFKINMGKVKPNRIYDVAIFSVGNPGDDYGCYKMIAGHMFEQPEKRVPSDWIAFTPETFCLNPGEWERVETKMYINPKTKLDNGLAGNYFSLLMACTYQDWVGACAGSKLNFKIGGK